MEGFLRIKKIRTKTFTENFRNKNKHKNKHKIYKKSKKHDINNPKRTAT